MKVRARAGARIADPIPGRWRRRRRDGIGDSRSPSYDDLLIESAVLVYVSERPDGVTIPDLSRQMHAGTVDDGEGSEVERAIRELVRARLLRIEGGRVVPDRAAIGDPGTA